MNARIVGIFVALLVATTADGQEAVKKSGKIAVQAEVKFRDGSKVYFVILEEELKILTKYGELTVPFPQVQHIEFGLHYPNKMEKSIESSIDRLGNDEYKDRENAAKFLLETGHFAYPMLKKAVTKPSSLERTKRTESILKQIEEKVSPDRLAIKTHDIVHTAEFPIIGRLQGDSLKAYWRNAGNMKLDFSEIESLHGIAGNREKKLHMNAAKHGSEPDQWLDTGMAMGPRNQLVILSEGKVDLWPQGPNQYITTPNGYTTTGKGLPFMAGALVGKIGSLGKVFLIGEYYKGTPSKEGNLFLHIVPSPWNNASSGSYNVIIRTE